MNNKNIVGIGEVLWDILPDGKQLGGAPANFVYHAKSLTGMGHPVSAIGKDELGEEIIEHFQKKGLSKSYIQKKDKYPTGTVDVELDNQGVPEYIIKKNVAWDNISYIKALKTLAAKTSAVCFGTLAQRTKNSRHTIQNFVKTMPNEAYKILDINLRKPFYNSLIVEQSIKIANILKLNQEELDIVADYTGIEGTEDEILKKLKDRYNLKLIALTKGDRGSKLVNDNYNEFLAAPKIEVDDTVGAGDSFTAALAAGLLQDMQLAKIHKFASDLAAYVCTQKGAMPDIKKNIIDKFIN